MWMANFIDWPVGSRLTGMSGAPQGLSPGADGIVSLHLVDLPDGQQGSEEMSMAHSHLPFAATSIHGTYPDGSEWMVLTQAATIHETKGFGTADQATKILHEQFRRYLQLNPEARVMSEVTVSRLELLLGFQERDTFMSDLVDWGVDELLAGMVCEMCNVELGEVVAGRETGCTFPDRDHYCTGDGFTDVFAQWSQGLLVPAETEENSDDGVGEGALRHVMLQSNRGLLSEDWSVSAVWTEGVLHIALCDYGDGPDGTKGLDIDDPLHLLTWMLGDRFVTSHREFMDYLELQGLRHSNWLDVSDRDTSDASMAPSGFSVKEGVDHSVMVFVRASSELDVCRVEDGRALTLALLRDRCQGVGAWDGVQALLDRSGTTATVRDRGYF